MSLQKAIARSFSKAARTYDKHAILQHEVGKRLLESLQHIPLQPNNILDLGAGTGEITKSIQKLYPRAAIFSLDITLSMLQQARLKNTKNCNPLCADAHFLPINNNSLDLILSNLMLPWCDITTVFSEIQRVLRPNGLFLFSTFGPLTLQELKSSWAEVDSYSHINEFIDMHHLGDALLKHSFKDPVIEMELLTLNYSNIKDLFYDLKGSGSCNLNQDQRLSLTGKNLLNTVMENYKKLLYSAGKIPATFEIIYGHARKKEQQRTNEVEVSIAIESIKKL